MEKTTEEDLRIELAALQQEKIKTQRIVYEAFEIYSNLNEELKRLYKQERELLELIHRAAGTAAD